MDIDESIPRVNKKLRSGGGTQFPRPNGREGRRPA